MKKQRKDKPKKERSPYSKRFIILDCEHQNITFKISKNLNNNKCIKFRNTLTNAPANLELK